MVHARGGAPARARLLALALVLLLPYDPCCFCTPLDPSQTYSEGVAHVRAWQVARYTPVRLAPHEPPPRRLRMPLLSHAREWMLELEAVGGVWAREALVSWSRAGRDGGGVDSAPWSGGREYAGRVTGEPGSRVTAVLGRDGLLDATIVLPSGAHYHLEPLHRHLYAPHNSTSPDHSHLHSLMYRARDVTPPDAPCPHSTALHSVPRVRRSRAAPPSPPELPLDLEAPYATSAPSPSSPSPRPRPRPRLHVDRSQLVVASAPPPSPPQPPRRPMEEDEEGEGAGTGERTACMLYLQADHLLWERLGGVEETLAVLARHVLVLNDIYSRTDFDGDGRPDNITFLIKRAHVHTRDALHDPHYRYPHNYGVEKFLELFSEEDYDAFCLAYMFTYRDFELGTLGLAWTGDLKNAGGVCERNGHYRGSMKSLNTGIVTLLNYGKHVPAAVSHVTLAHEIGHNFGSPHDPEECTPYGEQGNFIMFARATAGDKPNNNKFSACSMRAIRPVLAGKARPPAPHACFTRPQRAVCGNGVVEEGEQCDCGWAGECRDPCCRPMSTRSTHSGQHASQAQAAPCTLAPRAACSPSQGPCCAPDCRLRFATQCRADNGCREPAYCDGARPACPPSRHKPNRTVCDDNRLCYIGECTASLCLAYGLEPCQCEVRADRPRSACELCCREPAAPDGAAGGAAAGGGGGACVSTWEREDMTGAWAGAGAPCDHYRGYCDVFQVCRALDPQGPLATLRRLLQEPSRLLAALRHHWYAWALALCGAGALLAWCARPPTPHGAAAAAARKADPKLRAPVTQVHTTPANPNPTAAAAATPAHLHLIVHQPVRSKLPFKKKVALRTRTRKPAAVSSAAPAAATPAAVAPAAVAPATAATAPAAAAPVAATVSKPTKGSSSAGGRRVRLQLVYSPPFRLRVRVRRDRGSGTAPAPAAAAGAGGARSRRAPAAQRRAGAGHGHARRRHSEPQPPASAPATPPAATDAAVAAAAVASPRLQRSQSACLSAPLAPPGTPERASLTPGAPS